MDGLVKHWRAFSRKFPFPCTLDRMDYIEGKAHWIDRTFQSCNFSFILKGSGEFRQGGRVYQVQAPCVITQWPDDPVAYGPPPAQTWDELYLIYGRDSQDYLRARGFFHEERRIWSIANMKSLWPLVEELTSLAQMPNPADFADRVDCLCDRLVLESLRPADSYTQLSSDSLMDAIVSHMQEKLSLQYDFEDLAERHGLSLSTFRRRWQRTFHIPPQRYLLNLRIKHAQKLLTRTDLPIAQISEKCGFSDTLYFSRRFRIETNYSPSLYRGRYATFTH